MKAPSMSEWGVIKVVEWMVIFELAMERQTQHTGKVVCLFLLTDEPTILFLAFDTKCEVSREGRSFSVYFLYSLSLTGFH
jgi:hypothetical protein